MYPADLLDSYSPRRELLLYFDLADPRVTKSYFLTHWWMCRHYYHSFASLFVLSDHLPASSPLSVPSPSVRRAFTSIRQYIRLPVRPPVRPTASSFARQFVRSPVRPPATSSARLSARQFVRPPVRPRVRSPVCPPASSSARLFARQFVRSPVRPYVRLFVRSPACLRPIVRAVTSMSDRTVSPTACPYGNQHVRPSVSPYAESDNGRHY